MIMIGEEEEIKIKTNTIELNLFIYLFIQTLITLNKSKSLIIEEKNADDNQ